MGSQLATSVRQSVTAPLVSLLKPTSSHQQPLIPLSGLTTHNLTFPLRHRGEELDAQPKVSSATPANTLTRFHRIQARPKARWLKARWRCLPKGFWHLSLASRVFKCLLDAAPPHTLYMHLYQSHGFTLTLLCYEVHVVTCIKPRLCPASVVFFGSQCMNTASHLHTVKEKKYTHVSVFHSSLHWLQAHAGILLYEPNIVQQCLSTEYFAFDWYFVCRGHDIFCYSGGTGKSMFSWRLSVFVCFAGMEKTW